MKCNAKHMVSIVGLMSCFGTGFAGQYQGAIPFKANQIKTRYINLSSSEVAAKKNPTLARQFGIFLHDDKGMQKITRIHVEGTSETTLEVTILEEDIAACFAQKENDLKIQHSWCRPKQIGYGVLVGGGLLTAVVAANQRGHQQVKMAGVGLGVILAVGGATGMYIMSGEKARIENHITQVQDMSKQWNKTFEMPDLRSFSGVGTDKK